jgi:serine/threonine protein kinase
MGTYLNPSNEKFTMSLNSEIYVDKTGLIGRINSVVNTEQRFICISRPRRFGKSMAANMLTAYYSSGCDSRELFHELKIENNPSFETHLNQYNVIFLNMQEFLSATKTASGMVALIQKEVRSELLTQYPDSQKGKRPSLLNLLKNIAQDSSRKFIVIIDEWDCLFRKKNYNKKPETILKDQETYLDFLRDIFKDNEAIALAYMTGILPIKKYGTHSALNMFAEVSMVDPRGMSEYMGFTDSEVRGLCERYHLDYAEMAAWYNGYQLENNLAIYSPLSVVNAVQTHKLKNYWNETETYEALQDFIRMNFDGLKDTVTNLLAGIRKEISTRSFKNDMTTFTKADDVLTLLVHLGYLGYDEQTSEVFIPNSEVHEEFMTCIEDIGWDDTMEQIKDSEALLKATWNEDADTVAKLIEKAHAKNPSQTYNSEADLSHSVMTAYFIYRNYYERLFEVRSGNGVSDVIYIPKPNHPNIPALLIEFKWNHSAKSAIAQIKNKHYDWGLEAYKDNLLLIGINYSKATHQHTCNIKKFVP